MDTGTALALAGLGVTVVLAVFGWWYAHTEFERRTVHDERTAEIGEFRAKLTQCEENHRQAREDLSHVREELRDVRTQLEHSRRRVEELTAEKMDLLVRLVARRDGSAA